MPVLPQADPQGGVPGVQAQGQEERPQGRQADQEVPVIIGVTASRTWKDLKAISDAFDVAVAEFRPAGDPVIVIEGGAPGGDALCRAEAVGRGWHVATVRALWNRYGKPAGQIRNDAMIHLGANAAYWLAFIDQCVQAECHRPDPHDSHGAAGCAEMAELAGIDVKRYGWRF